MQNPKSFVLNTSAALFVSLEAALLITAILGVIFRPDTSIHAKPGLSAIPALEVQKFMDNETPSRIVASGLFGTSSPDEEGPAGNDVGPPLTLIGVIAVTRPLSLALVKTVDDGKFAIYRNGDQAAGYTVTGINATAVTLQRNGKTFKIGIHDTLAAQPAQASVAGGANQIKMTVSRSAITQICKGNLEELLKGVRAGPWRENDRIAGYKLYSIPSESVLTELSFKTGDVIKRINGHPADSMEKMYQLYQTLLKESQLGIDLQRGEETISIQYTITN